MGYRWRWGYNHHLNCPHTSNILEFTAESAEIYPWVALPSPSGSKNFNLEIEEVRKKIVRQTVTAANQLAPIAIRIQQLAGEIRPSVLFSIDGGICYISFSLPAG